MSSFLVCFMAFLTIGSSQTPYLNFDYYGLKQGLPSLITGFIAQDHQGFLWFDTEKGLVRLDGTRFKVYQHTPGDPHSLSTNSTGKILVDSKGNMWVGTNGKGINFYERSLDRFIRILHNRADSLSLSSDYVNDIFEDQKGRLWVATQEGLNLMTHWDPKEGKAQFKKFPHLPYKNIICLNELPKDQLWIGTGRNGVLAMDMENLSFRQFQYQDTAQETSLPSNLVKSFFNEENKYLWVCTSYGLSRIQINDDNQQEIKSFRYKKEDSLGIPFPFIHVIAKGSQDTYWMGTNDGGLIRMNWQKGERPVFEQILRKENTQNTLASNLTYGVFKDNSDNLWISTDKGIHKLSLSHQLQNRAAFQHLQIPRPKKESLKDVLALYEDEFGNLWVGTYGSGLYIFHAKRQEWIRPLLQEGSEKRLTNSIITTISQDKDGIYWIGTFGGLNKLEVAWEGDMPRVFIRWFLPDPKNPHSLNNKRVFAVHDQDSLLWIGTRGGGLSKFDKATEKFYTYKHDGENPNSISNDAVWSIAEDSKHRLWLATDNGLNIFRPSSQDFFSYQHDPSNPHGLANSLCNSVFRDSKNRMWIGLFGKGINVIHEDDAQEGEEAHFADISQSDGLVDDNIYCIIEDQEGYVWLSTPMGLSRINARGWDLGDPIPPNSIQNFYKADGLQEDEFNSGSSFINKDGWIYFGGINGLNKFHPSQISRNTQIPNVYITDVHVMNQRTSPGFALENGNVPLRKNPIDGGKLWLRHQDLVFNVSFAALNYIFPERNQYAYKLEGFDENWVYVGNESRATYTNLREGDYTFRVKASNNDGIWNEEGTSLQIHVSPPPWRTWWAYTLYILAAFSLIYGIFRFRLRQKEKQLETQWKINQAKIEERERVRKNAAADFHDELGNKTTKISLFVELAKRQAQMGKETDSFLDQINTHTRQLSDGIRDFIWVLDPEQDTLYNVINRAKEFGEELFEHTLTDFKVKGLNESFEKLILTVEQRRHLLMIIKEALHNVLKYAEASECMLKVEGEEGHITLYLSDNGKGFDPEKVKRGYGLNNMAERAEKIGAKFQINSEVGKGSQISINMEYPN